MENCEKREKTGLLRVKVEREINEKRVTRETLVLSSFGDPQKSDTLDLALILETFRSRRDSSSQLFAFITFLLHPSTILILFFFF